MPSQEDYQQGHIVRLAEGWYMAEDLIELLPYQMLDKIVRHVLDTAPLVAVHSLTSCEWGPHMAWSTVNETRISTKEDICQTTITPLSAKPD